VKSSRFVTIWQEELRGILDDLYHRFKGQVEREALEDYASEVLCSILEHQSYRHWHTKEEVKRQIGNRIRTARCRDRARTDRRVVAEAAFTTEWVHTKEEET